MPILFKPSSLSENDQPFLEDIGLKEYDNFFGKDGFKVIVYHHSDGDGYAGAAALYACAFPAAKYIPVQYGIKLDTSEISEENIVIVVDFSFDRETTLKISEITKQKLIVLDHHSTAKENLAGIPGCFFDMNSSGAKMAHLFAQALLCGTYEDVLDRIKVMFKTTISEQLYDNGWTFEEYLCDFWDEGVLKTRNAIVELADDYDKWEFKYGKFTDIFNESFGLIENDVKLSTLVQLYSSMNLEENSDLLGHMTSYIEFSKCTKNFFKPGENVVNYRDKVIDGIIAGKKYRRMNMVVWIDGKIQVFTAILSTMSGNNWYNNLAERLRNEDIEHYDVFVNAFLIGNEKVVLNFRQGKSDIDVSVIAKSLGGGGRAKTAGAGVSFFVYEKTFADIKS